MFTTHEARFKLWDLIKGVKFAMFGTHQLSGGMRSRPMTTQNAELAEDECLWFFMSRKGESFEDIGRDSNVNLSYADPARDVYVSVSGIACVVDSPERSRTLWSKLAQAWFPGGVGDPDLALVKIRITHADYWDVEKSKIIELFVSTEASVSGSARAVRGQAAEPKARVKSESKSRPEAMNDDGPWGLQVAMT